MQMLENVFFIVVMAALFFMSVFALWGVLGL